MTSAACNWTRVYAALTRLLPDVLCHLDLRRHKPFYFCVPEITTTTSTTTSTTTPGSNNNNNNISQGCRGYGDSHGDSHGYGYGMDMGTVMNPMHGPVGSLWGFLIGWRLSGNALNMQ